MSTAIFAFVFAFAGVIAFAAGPESKFADGQFEQLLSAVSKEEQSCVATYRKALAVRGSLIENTEQCPDTCFKDRDTTFAVIQGADALPALTAEKQVLSILSSFDLLKAPRQSDHFLRLQRKFLDVVSVAKLFKTGQIVGDPAEGMCASIGFYKLFKTAIYTAEKYHYSDSDRNKIGAFAVSYIRKGTAGPPILASHLLRTSLLQSLVESSLVKLHTSQRVQLKAIADEGAVARNQEASAAKFEITKPDQQRALALALWKNIQTVRTLDEKLAKVLHVAPY